MMAERRRSFVSKFRKTIRQDSVYYQKEKRHSLSISRLSSTWRQPENTHVSDLIRVPMYHTRELIGRSEIMEHNIDIGLKLSSYLISEGINPKEAAAAACNFLYNEHTALPCPPSFSPYRRAIEGRVNSSSITSQESKTQ